MKNTRCSSSDIAKLSSLDAADGTPTNCQIVAVFYDDVSFNLTATATPPNGT